jgi:hypothetical protein
MNTPMTDMQTNSPAPRPPFGIPSPSELKLRIPRIFRPGGSKDAAGGRAAINPAFEALVQRLVGLPPQTAILGLCEDDLPVLLDLADPAPGALLVACDEREQRLEVLRTLVYTAAALNSPRNVQFLVLSSQPQEWQGWLEGLAAARHCLGVESLEDGSCDRWLLKLSGWADQRRTGGINGPAVLLIVDDLAAATRLEYDARVNFDWLVKEGPAVKIWPMAAAEAEALPGLGRWVRLFKSRIFGRTIDAQVYRQAAQFSEEDLAMFDQPGQFAVRIQENWLKFRIPD